MLLRLLLLQDHHLLPCQLRGGCATQDVGGRDGCRSSEASKGTDYSAGVLLAVLLLVVLLASGRIRCCTLKERVDSCYGGRRGCRDASAVPCCRGWCRWCW